MTDIGRIIRELEQLPNFRTISCPQCNHKVRRSVLEMYSNCPSCDSKSKCRAFGGIGTELVDIIDAVLEWCGQGESLEAAMRRHQEIFSDVEL